MFGVTTLSVSALAVCCGANAYRMCMKLFEKEEHMICQEADKQRFASGSDEILRQWRRSSCGVRR